MTIKAYLVGGAVRDGILGLSTKDYDYAVEAPDFNSMVDWISSRGEVFLIQEQFWTVRAKLKNGKAADYVLCRKDGEYTDGRRPDTVQVGTLYEDLARRDFTVNAIALDEETGEYIDPFMGRNDLAVKMLKCVGESYDRFNEDALRLLRALRFHITKGFHLHPSIVLCLSDKHLVSKLKENVSTERKKDELNRCFEFDTLKTLEVLANFPKIKDACFGGNLWLQATQKERKKNS